MASRIRQIARNLRRRETEPERRFWNAVRSRQVMGWKFRRQHPVAGYVADFACVEARLVVELDGDHHDGQRDTDEKRTAKIEANGWRVLRFANSDVYENMDGVLRMIIAALPDRREPRASFLADEG